MIKNNYGRIVNIASIAGKEGNPNASAYSAAKAGVIGLTKSLGKELSDKNIAVNTVTPAAAKTRIFDQMTKEQLALKIATEIYKGKGKLESFHAYQCISSYFSDLSMDDLEGMAGQCGININ